MSNDEWEAIEYPDKRSIIEEINPCIQSKPFSPELTRLYVKQLSFYEQYKLYKMTIMTRRGDYSVNALRKPGHVVAFNGTTETIYELNKKAPVQINENNIIEYARFVLSCVRVREDGKIYRLVEKKEDIGDRPETGASDRFNAASNIRPLLLEALEKDGEYVLHGNFLTDRDRELISSEIRVDSRGKVNFPGQAQLLGVLPERLRKKLG